MGLNRQLKPVAGKINVCEGEIGLAKKELTLFDKFEFKGVWWFPNRPDAQLPGILMRDGEKSGSSEPSALWPITTGNTVHPTSAYFVRCRPRIFSLKNSRSRKP